MLEGVIPVRHGDGPVFEVVGRPTASGVTWVWARASLDRASEARARADLGGLLGGVGVPLVVLVYLGAERFVDVRGLRLLLELAGEVRDAGGSLAVVAPPRSLRTMLRVLDLGDQLPLVATTQEAVRRARRLTGH